MTKGWMTATVIGLFLSGWMGIVHGAESCTVTAKTCLEGPSQKRINGYIVTRDCWQWQETRSCSSGQSVDHCTTLAGTKGCVLEKEECLSMNGSGQCASTKRTYACDKAVSGLPSDNVALEVRVKVDTSFDKAGACASLIADTTCTEQSHVCSQTSGTRPVDGVDVTLSCWAEQYRYQCQTAPESLTCVLLGGVGCTKEKEIAATASLTTNQYACVVGKTATVPTHDDIRFIETRIVTDGFKTDDSACAPYEGSSTCSLTKATCTKNLTNDVCAEESRTYTCTGELDQDACSTLTGGPCQADQPTPTCTSSIPGTGVCLTAQQTYTCTTALPTPIPSNVKETGRKEVIDAITPTSTCPTFASTFAMRSLKASGACSVISRTCTEAGGTKVVNGENVTKDCWGYDVTYQCEGLGETVNGCAVWETNDTCRLVAEDCLAHNGSECTYTTRTYQCQESADQVLQEEKCTESICAYGFCETRDDEANTGLYDSVLKMEIARQAAVYGEFDDVQFFKGELNACENKQGQNCCAGKVKGAYSNDAGLGALYVFGADATMEAIKTVGSPYVYDILSSHESLEPLLNKLYGNAANGAYSPSLSYYGITVSYTGGSMALSFNPYVFFATVALEVATQYFACEPEEQALQLKKGQNLCVYLGSRCTQYNLGSCLVKEEKYCCYNSKLARIVQEAAKAQFGDNWGTMDRPDCGGLTTYEFMTLDFSKIDLSEFLSDIAKQQLAEIDPNRTLIQTTERVEALKNTTNQYQPMDTKTGVVAP